MNRHLSDSPDKHSLNRRSSPTDQWQTRSVSPVNNQTDSHSRPFGANPFPTFGPNFANQRFFTPRSSYFGPQNDNSVFNPTTNMNHNYGNSYPNGYEYNGPPIRGQPSYPISYDNNRPVYSTDQLSNIPTALIDSVDTNQLKMVLMAANRETNGPIAEKSVSPESTVSCSDLTPNSMDVLISKMKDLTEKENTIKKTLKDVEKKITSLDEELKDYEKKFALRERLKKIKVDLERDEDELVRNRSKVVSDMEKVNKLPNNSTKVLNKNSNESQIMDTIEKEDNSSERVENQTSMAAPKSALKRPNPSVTKPNPISNPNKKVKINQTVSHSTGISTQMNTTPKVSTKPPIKRTPIPSKLKPITHNSHKVSEVSDSPKVNRICRQTPNSTPVSAVTSGVRTSKPQKLTSSRKQSSPQKSNQSTPSTASLAPKITKSSETSTHSSESSIKDSENTSIEPESDNEVFKELEKISSKIDSNIKSSNMNTMLKCENCTQVLTSPVTQCRHCGHQNKSRINSMTTIATQKLNSSSAPLESEIISSVIDSNIKSSNKGSDNSEQTSLPSYESDINEDKMEEQVIETNKSIDDNVFESPKNVENVSQSDTNSKNCEKVIDLVDIDSGDEEFTPQEEQMSEIKVEKPDSELDPDFAEKIRESADNLLTEDSRKALHLIPMRKLSKSSESSERSDFSEDQSITKESPFKVPNESINNKKKHLKFTGFDDIPYESSVCYTICQFKAIAGPKSKTVVTTVIFLKPFKDYLFASFMDHSVRRYHIEDKNNVLKYEGHENLVLTFIIIECPKSADTFILYTGGKDKKLRAFNAMSGQLLNSIELSDEITCIVYNWSHIFCALNNGNVCKVAPIHESMEEITDISSKVKSFLVNFKKKIMAIVSVKAVDPIDSNIEAIVALSYNKLRIVNTIDSISDEQRILASFAVHFSAPVLMRTFRNILMVSFKCPPVKSEDKTKKEDKSRILMYDLTKGWDAIKTIDMNGVITAMDLSAEELIVSCYSGKIQCIDCEKLEVKWISYSSRVTAIVKIGDRLVVGNDQGVIDVIYLDQQFMDCETCGVTYARQIDYKKHIQLEHKSSDDSDDG